MAFRPLHDRVPLRRPDGEATTKGGIIPDPVKVVRTALRDAAAVAGVLVTTEALVADRPKDKAVLPAPAAPDV